MNLILTVDTELSSHPEKMGILGKLNGSEYGISKIMDICDKYGIKATFFVDVYGYKRIGIDEMKEICHSVLKRGHDVQLHTHPDVYDKKRGYMALYSLDEQIKIIAEGKEFFEKNLGFSPIAHRAGDWGADYNTLKALERNNIPVDCSMFFGWPQCNLIEPTLTKNRCVKYGNILEVPATVFVSPSLGIFSSYRLFDLNANPVTELLSILKKLKRAGKEVVVLTLHSFSFLNWNKERTKYWVDNLKIKEFDNFLKKVLSQDDISFVTMKEFYEIKNKENDITDETEFIPNSGYGFASYRIWHKLLNTIADKVKIT